MALPEPTQTELAPGDVFADRYEIQALLGRGGMGAVYRALDRSLGDVIALKTMSFGPEATSRAVLRFRQEVRLARRVTHPNVARVYDLGEHDGVLYLTMELVEGITLRALLRAEGRLAPVRAVRIGRALAEGLGAAHAAGIIHRDLKPPNVLIDRTGRVVIGDFGIARSLTESSDLTVGAIGTPSYMAPEQLSSGPIDARTDLYALGLLVYEMLTGDRPEGTSDDITNKLTRDELVLPAALSRVVLELLARDPAERPRSAAEVVRLFDEALPEAAIDASEEPTVDAGTAERVDRGALTRPAVTRAPARSAPSLATETGVRPSTRALEIGSRALAVLPFRYRGPKESEHLAEGITDELVDVLSRTRGLVVLGSGATAKYKDLRDPRSIGADLGAYAVIDGTVELAGERVRITARLLETRGGVQLWSERHEGGMCDVFRLQETIARRVAEELRVELTTLARRGDAPAEAIELYLAARHKLRAFDFAGAVAAAEALARCVELAPDFGPGLAAHAMACLRSWFFGGGEGPIDWEKEAAASVARAMARAPDLAETVFASAVYATHRGDYAASARALRATLVIAPTYADAHEYLGMLECESGRAEEGVRRLELADELDPTLTYCLVFIARHHALQGRWDASEASLAELDRRRGARVGPLTMSQRIRFAAWGGGDRDAIRRWSLEEWSGNAANRAIVRHYARAFLGELDPAAIEEGFARVLSATQNPRYVALTTQLAIEAHATVGDFDAARAHLERAADSALVDMDWLERCPLLAALRALPEFVSVRRRVRARAEAIWAF